MREVKFRAWDKLRKRMSLVYRIYFDTQDVQLSNDFGLYWRKLKDVVLQQFTGLKDKNGVAIFEGDIIDGKSIGADRGNVKVISENGTFVLAIDYWTTNPLLVNYSEFVEVIGNIHENGELLKEDDNE